MQALGVVPRLVSVQRGGDGEGRPTPRHQLAYKWLVAAVSRGLVVPASQSRNSNELGVPGVLRLQCTLVSQVKASSSKIKLLQHSLKGLLVSIRPSTPRHVTCEGLLLGVRPPVAPHAESGGKGVAAAGEGARVPGGTSLGWHNRLYFGRLQLRVMGPARGLYMI